MFRWRNRGHVNSTCVLRNTHQGQGPGSAVHRVRPVTSIPSSRSVNEGRAMKFLPSPFAAFVVHGLRGLSWLPACAMTRPSPPAMRGQSWPLTAASSVSFPSVFFQTFRVHI